MLRGTSLLLGLALLARGAAAAGPDSAEYSESLLGAADEAPAWDSAEEAAAEGQDLYYTYLSVCLVDGRPRLVDGLDCRQQVALGRWKNAINRTGWSFLEVETFEGASADLQAYAAGLVEGRLSRTVLEYHLQNTYYDYCKGFSQYCARLNKYLAENLAYLRERVEAAPADDVYWQAVKRALLQLSGLWDGFKGLPLNPRILYEVTPVYLININGELYDLEKKFNKSADPLRPSAGEKCSGLVKLAPDNADLFISQVTMSGFQNLLRVLKLYKFGYEKLMFAGRTNTFSSYPGMLYSSDDFALTSAGLAVIETTVSIFNNSVLDKVSARGQLHTWLRAIVANQLARSGREWCQIFARHNSGTYNNQWLVLDYKLFKPRAAPPPGLLYVLEQMPGNVVFADETAYLAEKRYFASYNIPFYKETARLSGFDKKGGEFYWFSWADCPRANIFRRDQHKVVDLDSLTRLMRYNDYQHEPFSRCNCTPPFTAEAAISSRGDLNPANGTFPLPGMGHVNHGALDYKGTNAALAAELRFRAWGGPTFGQVPPFSWSTSDLAKTVKHVGHPDRWTFRPLEYRWETRP